MPIDAVWILTTVPRKNFEQSLIAINHKLEDADQYKEIFREDFYEIKGVKKHYLEKTLEDALEFLNIHDAVWVPSKNGLYYHVYFTCDMDSNDHAMYYLKSKGIGSKRNSTIGYIPFSLFYFNEDPPVSSDSVDHNVEYFNEIRDSFLKSITSRLTVAQIVEGVKNGAEITFDFYMYLLLSSMIAAMGIMNNSPVDIAASMMIEPLMGCVMAISFGLAMRTRVLVWTGLKSLVVGMLFCLAFGYIYGVIFQIWRVAWNPPPDGMWPTAEMQTRGQYRTLIYGMFIAIAGGAVLAVIMLKNNLVAVTGVAVATTFMPPFVNGGLCLALATHLQISGSYQDYQGYNISNVEYHLKPAWSPPEKYQTQYAVDMRIEMLYLAGISFAYTFVNIFFLLVSSYVVLKIKEITPIKHLLPAEHKFFSEDIQIYREYQRKYPTGDNTGKQILEEWADISGISKNKLLSNNPDAKATRIQTLHDIISDVEADANYQSITRNAFGSKFQPNLGRRLTQPTIDNSVLTLFNQNINSNIVEAKQNNLTNTIFTLKPPNNGEKLPGRTLPIGYATLRQSNQNRLRSSLWPAGSSSENSQRPGSKPRLRTQSSMIAE